MANRGRWTTREAVKTALGSATADDDAVIDELIEAESREFESRVHTWFVPRTEARSYDWPQRFGRVWSVFVDAHLLSVTSLTREGTDVVAIAAADYFLEPVNTPPYHRIDIDLASTSYFAAKDTHQRQIVVTGLWGKTNDTTAAGALAEALDSSETGVDVTDASLVGVGDTIKVDSEQLFVTGKSLLTTTTTTGANDDALDSDQTVAVADGTKVKAGEVIQIDSEQMLVRSIAANNLTVTRAYNGSTLAAHTSGATVYAFRTLTVERGVNGTTAATHDSAAAIVRYVIPGDVSSAVRGAVIAKLHQQRAGWGRTVGAGEGAREWNGRDLHAMYERTVNRHRRHVIGGA